MTTSTTMRFTSELKRRDKKQGYFTNICTHMEGIFDIDMDLMAMVKVRIIPRARVALGKSLINFP